MKMTSIARSTVLTFVLLFITIGQEVSAQQDKPELKDFELTLTSTEKGISLKSVEGSAWVNLSFSLKNYKPVAVDEYGMTKLKRVSKKKDPKIADFLFTVIRTEDGYELKGIEGTSWTDLKFSLGENETMTIDQFGAKKS